MCYLLMDLYVKQIDCTTIKGGVGVSKWWCCCCLNGFNNGVLGRSECTINNYGVGV